MGINFNGQVTINGNVEMYENGSMKISVNQISLNIDSLPKFIEENLHNSQNKADYIEASQVLKTSNEPLKLKAAMNKLTEMAKELGKNILFTGISHEVINAIKDVLNK